MEDFGPHKLINNNDYKFKIMSYNVRCCNDKLRYDIDGSVKTRAKYVINNILLYMPDTIGLQEVTISNNPKQITWFSLLKSGLKEYYEGVGIGRNKGNNGEANPIFYNKTKLELI